MTDLLPALTLEPATCIAVVGAGGKTTLCWRLTQEIAARGGRAIFTTTTRIWQPAPGTFDVMLLEKSDFWMRSDFSSGAWRTACVATAVDGPINAAPVSGSYMPVVQTKLAGFAGDQICEMHRQLKTQDPELRLVVEADGARGLRIKAPGQGEPVIPPCADAVCALASLEAIGRPLDDRIVHRIDRVASLTRTMPGSIITASLIVDLLAHADGGLKGMPAGARKVAVLTQQGEHGAHPDAHSMLAELRARGYDRAVLLSPRAAQPILAAA